MTDEEYEMELILVVQESETAMDKGNIYASALIRSENTAKNPYHAHKMIFIKPKATIILSIK
jgi:hypothetical protein